MTSEKRVRELKAMLANRKADYSHKFYIGTVVMWRGGFGTDEPKLATIIGHGEKNDKPVYDLDNGHWCYQDQLSPVEN